MKKIYILALALVTCSFITANTQAMYLDDEDDLVYYGYRYYNPTHGRWISRDPIQELGTSLSGTPINGDGENMENTYAFVVNNSINEVDFLGELGFTTSVNPNAQSTCGGATWVRKWTLGPSEINGFIIQEVTRSYNIFTCANVLTPASKHQVFWEAWPVTGGSSNPAHDGFLIPKSLSGTGTYGLEIDQGKARFYRIAKLPSSFSTATGALLRTGTPPLPATLTPPALWSASGSWVGNTVNASLFVTWNCCSCPFSTKVQAFPLEQ